MAVNEPDKMQVLIKDDVSYVFVGGYRRYSQDEYLINGKKWPPAPGSNKWVMLDGDVKTVVKIVHNRKKLTEWRIRKDCAATGKSSVSPGSTFDPFDEYPPGHDRHFYEPFYESQDDTFEDVPFEVIDRNSSPVDMPGYVIVDFPASIAKCQAVKHNYPCRVNAETMYEILAARVNECCDKDAEFRRDNYDSIQTKTVDRRISIPADLQKTVYREVHNWGRRKSKRKACRDVEKWVTVLQFVGTYKKDGGDSVIQLRSISGDNWADLQEKIEEYIQVFLDVFSQERLQVCTTCKGLGIEKFNAT